MDYEYIEKSFVLYAINYFMNMQTWNKEDIAAVLKRVIESAPAADVAKVRPGKWLTTQNDTIRGQKFTCSICGKIAYFPQPTRSKNWVKHCGYEYCPHCGARMDGKDSGND